MPLTAAKQIPALLLLAIILVPSVHSQPIHYGNTISDEVVLQVVLDRFRDGNPQNNTPTELKYRGEPIGPDFPKKIYDPSHSKIHYYFGGDLQGLMATIPEIKKLGFSAVWISPHMLQASAIDHDGSQEVTAYHGYWIKDWFRIDPHLTRTGNDDDYGLFLEFVRQCHDNDLKVIIDIVYNHSNPFDLAPPLKHEQGRVERQGVFIADFTSPYITLFPNENGPRLNWFNPKLDYSQFTSYCDFIRAPPDNTCGHSVGALYGTLADFNPYYGPYLEYMKDATKFWIKFGIDGLRLDTFIDVPIWTWNEILGSANEAFEHNRRHGDHKPLARKMLLMGELWGAGPDYGRDYARGVHVHDAEAGTQLVSLMDFKLADEIVRLMGRRGGHQFSVNTLLELASGNSYIDSESGYNFGYGMTTFFDNHDRKLLIHHTWNEDEKYEGCSPLSSSPLKADKDGAGVLIDYKRAINQATVFLLSVRGMPIFYYADLQHKQPPCYPYRNEGRCTRPMLTPSGPLVEDMELSTILRGMSNLRRREIDGVPNASYNEATAKGDFRQLTLEEKLFSTNYAGCYLDGTMRNSYRRSELTYAFERCTKDQESCLIIIGSINFAAGVDGDQFKVYDLGIPVGKYKDTLSGRTIIVDMGEDGRRSAELCLKNYETVVISYKKR